MYTVHIPKLGFVSFRKSGIYAKGKRLCIMSNDGNIVLLADKIRKPTSQPDDCGYCHITSYTMHGKTTMCNIYLALR
jgi:hypothetical protein